MSTITSLSIKYGRRLRGH